MSQFPARLGLSARRSFCYPQPLALQRSQWRVFSSFNLREVLESPEKLLLTPGPLSTSPSVKACMTRDFGSRDGAFINLVKSVRQGILDAGSVDDSYTSILMQGSGTFAVEAAISTSVPRGGRILVITNGAYADRAATIARYASIDVEVLRYQEDTKPVPKDVDEIIAQNKQKGTPFTNVFMVHSETTSGLINPIEEVGAVVKGHGLRYIVDAMSSYGGVPIDLAGCHIDLLVTSANKCLQGVPGFGIVIAKKDVLADCAGNSRSLSLDLQDQAKGLDSNGQFRFTPPTHTICAFQKALEELAEEGGIAKRTERYQKNQAIVTKAVLDLGFELYLNSQDCGHIITSIRYPKSPNWDFEKFYQRIAETGFLIYPGKVTNADCFRIGHIGHIYPEDSERFVSHLRDICADMKLFEQTKQ